MPSDFLPKRESELMDFALNFDQRLTATPGEFGLDASDAAAFHTLYLSTKAAYDLGVQERTIKAHLTTIFDKLGVRNRTQAGILLRSLELADPAQLPVP